MGWCVFSRGASQCCAATPRVQQLAAAACCAAGEAVAASEAHGQSCGTYVLPHTWLDSKPCAFITLVISAVKSAALDREHEL